MLYVSTRGGVRGVSFVQALLSGCSPDGGLYVPQTIPKLRQEEWKELAALNYEELSKKLFRLFVSRDEIPDADYNGLFRDVYSSIKHSEVLPIVSLGDLNVVEMWHGPSGSLKDFSLAIVTKLLSYFMEQNKVKAVGVVGTLGDTGCAAIQNVVGRDNLRLIVLFPEKGVSELQRLSMTTVNSPYIKTFACECASDEFDKDIKKVFSDDQFAKEHHLLWLNSQNIGRVLSHVIYHAYIYLKLCPDVDQEVTVYLPTGGGGNATGGCIAQIMGLPIKTVAAVNENDALFKCFSSGILEKSISMVNTYACALDCSSIPNIERMLYLLSKFNVKLVKEIMLKYEEGHKVNLPDNVWSNKMIRSIRVDQEKALEEATKLWREYNYMICPHTAVAVAALAVDKRQRETAVKSAICYSTATSAKFPKFVKAVDATAPLTKHPLTEGLKGKAERVAVMKADENWEEILRECIKDLSCL